MVGHRARDRKVAGLTPGRGAIKSTRSIQPSIPPGWVNRVPASMAGVRRGVFTYVGCRVTLCNPIWQVTSRSFEVGIPSGRAISAFTFFLPLSLYYGIAITFSVCLISLYCSRWSRMLYFTDQMPCCLPNNTESISVSNQQLFKFNSETFKSTKLFHKFTSHLTTATDTIHGRLLYTIEIVV